MAEHVLFQKHIIVPWYGDLQSQCLVPGVSLLQQHGSWQVLKPLGMESQLAPLVMLNTMVLKASSHYPLDSRCNHSPLQIPQNNTKQNTQPYTNKILFSPTQHYSNKALASRPS